MNELGLTEHQTRIARRVLAEEGQRRTHLVVSLSGAHAYGFPSPDSDLDLKAVHVAPTASLLGLYERPQTADRLEIIEGVEIDYTSNELQVVLRGVLAGNGNFVERLLGPSVLEQSPILSSLRPLVAGALSKKVYRHYRGFAMSQRKELEGSPQPTTKRILYVLRTALTGVHLLRTAEVVTDLGLICDRYGFSDARALIEAKRAGEKSPLAPEVLAAWQGELDRAFVLLDQSLAESRLPEEVDPGPLEAWLISVRLGAPLGSPGPESG